MVKRKFLMSVIITLVAAITLVSGTYAWFLVGGFGSLFDIGFNVMEAGAGLELRGSAGDVTTGWKSNLEREDFLENSFIPENGTYKLVSSSTGTNDFVKIGLEGNNFKIVGDGKGTSGTDYNDFYLFIRSTDQQPQNIGMTIKMSGNLITDKNKVEAVKAGRVSVTYGGKTTIFGLADPGSDHPNDGTEAVTKIDQIDTVTDTDGDRIITNKDENYSVANLTEQQNYKDLRANGLIMGKNGAADETFILEDCGGSAEGSRVDVRVWIEGNDYDCVDILERTISGGDFKVEIGFTALGNE